MNLHIVELGGCGGSCGWGCGSVFDKPPHGGGGCDSVYGCDNCISDPPPHGLVGWLWWLLWLGLWYRF